MALESTADTSYCGRAEARPENVPELRNGAVAFAAGAGAAPAALDSVKLAGSEALTNVVRHAYIESDQPGPMIVETWVDQDAVLMVVCDEGCGLKPRPDSPGLGLGLPLLAQVADDFRVEDRPGRQGTRVSLRFSLDGSGTELAA